MSDHRILRLRVELFSALQMLKGADLAEFVDLINDVHACLPSRPETREDEADSDATLGLTRGVQK